MLFIIKKSYNFAFIWFYFIIKLIILFMSTFEIWINIAAIARNGPNGIRLSFLLSNMYIAIGKAINVAKKILHIDSG